VSVLALLLHLRPADWLAVMLKFMAVG
jgi:hypothetical protein